ncbi:MAG: TlyA family RNA methyltransferase [Candidatus Limivicinus sp.]
MEKIRLDQLLLERGYAESRERAKALVMSGAVFLDGRRADKPGLQVTRECEPEVHGSTLRYVSRGGLKLEKALKVFDVDPTGKTCIDCGASTGGFTDVLLQNGAKKVYAVDVGYGQLAWKLRQDERVVNIERCNLRYLTEEQVPEKLDLAVMDVSFISIRLILPVIRPFLKEDADFICLIKPQFEAGRGQVGKKGIVREPAIHFDVIRACLDAAREDGYAVKGLDWSPIRGADGNIEFLCHLKKSEAAEKTPDSVIAAVVEAAHGGQP